MLPASLRPIPWMLSAAPYPSPQMLPASPGCSPHPHSPSHECLTASPCPIPWAFPVVLHPIPLMRLLQDSPSPVPSRAGSPHRHAQSAARAVPLGQLPPSEPIDSQDTALAHWDAVGASAQQGRTVPGHPNGDVRGLKKSLSCPRPPKAAGHHPEHHPGSLTLAPHCATHTVPWHCANTAAPSLPTTALPGWDSRASGGHCWPMGRVPAWHQPSVQLAQGAGLVPQGLPLLSCRCP